MENNIDGLSLIKQLYKSADWNFTYDVATVHTVFEHLPEELKTMYAGAFIVIAAWYKSPELLAALKLSINSANTTSDKSTALIICAGNNNINVAQFLMDQGAECNFQNEQGDIALHVASFYGHLDFVNFLLAAGANPSLRNHKSFSPLDCALTGFFSAVKVSSFKMRNLVYKDIIASLIAAGADIKDTDSHGRTVIDEVILSQSQIVDLLEGTNLSMLARHQKDVLCNDMKETIKIIEQLKGMLDPHFMSVSE